MITESDGTVPSAHCLGCKAGLGKTCTHVASALIILFAKGKRKVSLYANQMGVDFTNNYGLVTTTVVCACFMHDHTGIF